MSKTKLSSDQVELLYDAQKCTDPVVCEREDLDALKAVMAHDLTENHGLKEETIEEMSIAAMARQYTDGDTSTDSLSVQMPETGGGNPAESPTTNGVDVETLGASTAQQAYRRVKLLETLERRGVTKRAGEIREEVAETLGCEPEDVPSKKELQAVIEG